MLSKVVLRKEETVRWPFQNTQFTSPKGCTCLELEDGAGERCGLSRLGVAAPGELPGEYTSGFTDDVIFTIGPNRQKQAHRCLKEFAR